MKNSKNLILIIAILITTILIGSIVYLRGAEGITTLEIVILFFIISFGIVAIVLAIRKSKALKEGFPEEDELSTLIKYKSGYYAYLFSMYMWLFIFLFKDYFPDIETMLGGGILLSALIGFMAKFNFKRQLNDE